MSAGNPDLVAFIRDQLHRRGPLPFRWFMEQALYHPTFGYYSSGRANIGRRGDYFTNVSVGPLFGSIMAAQFAQMWEALDKPAPFTILEQGSHHGDFARDVLEAAQHQNPQFFAAIRYEIIEPFAVLKARQKSALAPFTRKVTWQDSLDDVPRFRGVHFCNELLDAMPVHLVSAQDRFDVTTSSSKFPWQEKYVTTTSGRLEFVEGPISTPQLRKHLQQLPRPAAPYQTEINLECLDWITAASHKLECGYILIVDYGYPRLQFYAPERTTGTLRCYAAHQIVSSPLADPGHVDITAHVDWTSLAERAEKCGLKPVGFVDQHHFMTGVIASLLGPELANASPKKRRALQTLLNPGLLGMTFQYLGLAKSVEPEQKLSGFQFASDVESALGLV